MSTPIYWKQTKKKQRKNNNKKKTKKKKQKQKTKTKKKQQKNKKYISKRLLKFLPSIQGPVVQSIVILTSSLRVISLSVLADSIYNILIFFAEKMWVAFALQKLLTFFQQKISAFLRIIRCKF